MVSLTVIIIDFKMDLITCNSSFIISLLLVQYLGFKFDKKINE